MKERPEAPCCPVEAGNEEPVSRQARRPRHIPVSWGGECRGNASLFR